MGMVEKDEQIEIEEIPDDEEMKLEEQTLIASIIIHAADISGAAKQETIEMKWARLVTTEFIAQREAEETLKVRRSEGGSRVYYIRTYTSIYRYKNKYRYFI